MTPPPPKFGLKTTGPINRRKHERLACFLRAQIIARDGDVSLECSAHDISESGMRLKDAHFATVPDRFLLRVPRRHMEVIVHVVRRRAEELGVEFVGPSP